MLPCVMGDPSNVTLRHTEQHLLSRMIPPSPLLGGKKYPAYMALKAAFINLAFDLPHRTVIIMFL